MMTNHEGVVSITLRHMEIPSKQPYNGFKKILDEYWYRYRFPFSFNEILGMEVLTISPYCLQLDNKC